MAFDLFKKKKRIKDKKYHTLTVREVVPIAKDAVNLVFELPVPFEYAPGQFITIIQSVNGRKIRRAYSLCTTPYIDKFPAVTVKRVPNGVMSNFLNDHVQAGFQLNIMEPMGMFTTRYHKSNCRKAFFFGGGSGITPLISIIRSILWMEPQSEVVLVYGNRSEKYIIFKDLIEMLKTKHTDRFKAIHILEEGNSHYIGLPTKEMIKEICEEVGGDKDTEFYVCGPQPMMDVVIAGIEEAGYPSDHVRVESFEAGKTTPSELTKEEKKSEVAIFLNDVEYFITVPRDAAILETALNNDLDMPYSCQSGLCTACRGRCVQGKVSLDEAEGLSQEEVDKGYVLTCVGKPLTDFVRIEME